MGFFKRIRLFSAFIKDRVLEELLHKTVIGIREPDVRVWINVH